MSASQPSTNDYDTAARIALASFIAWQVAVVENVDSDGLARAIVSDAQANIETLMLGKALRVGETDITLNNEVGTALGRFYTDSLSALGDTLEKEANNAATV